MSTVTARPYVDGEWDLFLRLDEVAFGYTSPDGEDRSTALAVMRHEQSLIGEVDGRPVGLLASYDPPFSVPGGADLPTAGTTWVGVLPTHRRRGVLRAMMTRHLRESRERGSAIAALWASQGVIYQRFGYGAAAPSLRLRVHRHEALELLPPALAERAAGFDLAIEPVEEVRGELEAVYAAAAAVRPGAPRRDASWWDRILVDLPSHREGGSEKRILVVRDPDGRAAAYARFNTKLDFNDAFEPDGTLRVFELLSTDVAARAAAWQVLLAHDLMVRIEWVNAPGDEPLLRWIPDRDAVIGVGEGAYVRLLDVPAALTARTYAGPCDVVFEVVDDVVPEAAGRWRLVVDGAGRAECARTSDAPHATLPVAALGSAYLGAHTLTALADAGFVGVHDRVRLAAAAAAFRHEPVAWCPHIF